MVALRLVGLLFLIAIALCLALFVVSRNRRYLTFAWRIFQFGVIFLLTFMALYIVERLLRVA